VTGRPSERCLNCGAPLYGPHCYACGQPKKGLIRQFSSILGDFFDTVLSLDQRTFRTLFPLYFQPGFLTTEYFEGRRVRYVTPLRLYFFLSVIAFLVISLVARPDLSAGPNGLTIGSDNDPKALARLDPEARTKRLAEIEQAFVLVPEEQRKEAMDDLRREVDQELQSIAKRRQGKPEGAPDPDDDEGVPHYVFNRQALGPGRQPGARRVAERGHEPVAQRRDRRGDPQGQGRPQGPGTAGQAGVLAGAAGAVRDPAAVRAAAEGGVSVQAAAVHGAPDRGAPQPQLHLPVAARGDRARQARDRGRSAWARCPDCSSWLLIAACTWVFLYLLLMQKRVYRQGWIMTLLKFGFVGIAYTILLSLGMAATFVVSLIVL
jgi:hypothetical protein